MFKLLVGVGLFLAASVVFIGGAWLLAKMGEISNRWCERYFSPEAMMWIEPILYTWPLILPMLYMVGHLIVESFPK